MEYTAVRRSGLDNSLVVDAVENAGHMAPELGRPLPQLFALIIGIDDYANCERLRGAVADAKAIKQWLEEVLQVSEDHISTLFNNEATRGAIIKAFRNLQNDERIKKGDPIVIFYAGHGSELPPPPAWRVNGKIQCLLPQDYKAAGTEPIPDRAPIPDRTIGALIEDIAKAKGDNITVIFDCCHSASGTRDKHKMKDDSTLSSATGTGDQDEKYVPRTVKLNINIPEALDHGIWRGRAGSIHSGFAYHGLRSHVLLAACGQEERAYEHEGRGQFTSALLTTLEAYGINDITYTEVLERVHLEKQNPHCEGLNRHRVLFDTRVPAGRHTWYPVQSGIGKYVISGGLSHGIARGVEFTLYDHQRHRLGVVLVDDTSSIDDFETTVTKSVHLEDVSLAKLTRIGKVPLYLENDLVLKETLRKMDESGTSAPKFWIVRDVEEAKLQIARENNQAIFKILDKRVQRLGLTELPYKTAPDHLVHVLGAVAHYFWYLDLRNENSRLGTNHEVIVNFYSLRRDYDDDGVPILIPVEPGFCRRDPSLGNSDVIDFVVEPAGRYGVEIKNNTKRDLYLNVFLFNNGSLSVVPCYTLQTCSSGKPEAPLKQGGTFTIGYGTGGTSPLQYSLEKNQDVDVGYLKIFLATLPIDLCDIEQMSPFSNMHPPPEGDRRVGVQNQVLPGARNIWFTVVIPVVQRRKKTDAVAC